MVSEKTSESLGLQADPASSEYSLEGLMLILRLQCLGHQIQRANSLMLRKTEGKRRRGQQKMRRMDGFTDSMGHELGKLWEMVKDRETWPAVVHGVTKSQARLSS